MMNQTVGYGDKQTTWGPTLLLKIRAHYMTEKIKKPVLLPLNLGVKGLILKKVGKRA